MSLSTTNLQLQIDTGETVTSGIGTAKYPLPYLYQEQLTDGTGANKAQKVVSVSGSVTDGAPVTHDLTAIVGPFATVAFSKLKAIVVENTDDTDALDVGGAGSNALAGAGGPLKDPTDIAPVPAGAAVAFLHPGTGYTVDATHKNLQIAAQSGTVAYKLLLIGEGT